jgi:hypothetical protein
VGAEGTFDPLEQVLPAGGANAAPVATQVREADAQNDAIGLQLS